MPVRFVVVLIGIGICLGSPVQGQSGSNVSVTAEARPTEVGTAETVTFVIQVRGVPLSAIEASDAPPTTNLVLQEPTPATNRELSFESGSLRRRVTIRWTYRPMQVGIGRIEPATIRIRGEEHTTDEVRVRVVPQSQRAQTATQPPPGEDRSSPPATGSKETRVEPRDLLIRAAASADTVYQNEQVTVEYSLFFRPGVRLRQSRLADAWDAPGFWREELDVASRPTPRSTNLYGQTYKSIVLKRVALFPTQTGLLRVDPLRIRTEARSRPRIGRRESVPRGRYKPVTLSSEELTIVARSLPSEAPPDFNGAVGEFTLDTEVRADSVEVGDAVEMTARIRGTGNIATISPPIIDPPTGVDTYEPSIETDIDQSASSVRGTKTFRYTLVPRSNGGYTLPPVSFSYFDPETQRYETLRSSPTTLQVTGDVPPRAASRTGEGLPIGDIAGPIEDEVRWVRTDRAPLYAQPWAYAAVIFPVLLAAGGILYRRHVLGSEAVADDDANALDAAQRHLRDAHRHLRSGDVQGFYRTVSHTMTTFLQARLNQFELPSGRTREALGRHLEHHAVPPTHRDAILELLDACDEAQYTPAEPSYDSMEAVLNHAQALLLRLDEELPPSSTPND